MKDVSKTHHETYGVSYRIGGAGDDDENEPFSPSPTIYFVDQRAHNVYYLGPAKEASVVPFNGMKNVWL